MSTLKVFFCFEGGPPSGSAPFGMPPPYPAMPPPGAFPYPPAGSAPPPAAAPPLVVPPAINMGPIYNAVGLISTHNNSLTFLKCWFINENVL